MKKLFAIGCLAAALIFCLAIKSKAQTAAITTSKTTSNTAASSSAPTVFVEFGGPGLFVSGNFDSRFGKRRNGLGGRVGLGYLVNDGISFFSLPVQLNYLAGKKGNYFEMGAGATYASISDPSHRDEDFFDFNGNTVIGTLTLGYRYQPINGGFNFRAAFTPLFNSENLVPYAGLSFGYSFK